MTGSTLYRQAGATVVIATKKNPEVRTAPRPWRRTFLASVAPETGRSAVVCGRPTGLAEAIVTEINRSGIPASYAVPPQISRSWLGAPVAPYPITVGRRSGAEAIVVVIDRSLVEFLFGRSGDGRPNRWFLGPARARACENRLCDRVTATAAEARRLLIVCDAEHASMPERARAIRWIRELAHRIGYECAINGLPNLGTSYLVLVADVEAGAVARSVVDWYGSGEVRCAREGGSRDLGAGIDRSARSEPDDGATTPRSG